MTATATNPSTHALPETSTATAILLGILVALVVLAGAVWTWGLPVLAMTALAAVPVMMVVLLMISRG